MKKIIIAIDGFSSTGKSTVAKQLAEILGYIYVDTGAMYRAVTLFALQKGWLTKEVVARERINAHLEEIDLQFKFNPELGFSEMYLNGENVEKQIRGMRVSQSVSQLAQIPEVRAFLVRQQKAMGEKKGIVMDGRDIGTVVFPEAELKFFMTASAEVRAQRRYKELQKKGEKVNFAEVYHNIQERDELDSTRKDSPLRKAKDAVEIDNSELSQKEQLQKIVVIAKTSIEKENM